MDIERKVFVLYTGGTFGMKPDDEGRLAPQPLEVIQDFIIQHTILYERKPGESEDDVRNRIITPDGFMTLYTQLCKDDPNVKGKHCKILYKFDGLQKPIDSSSATPEDWSKMAKIILDNTEVYDGFVIIHGTDTMAFTSSALSFILGHINKPVIVTGAQIPIFHPRSDGLGNLVNSMLMAGYFSERSILHKVMLCYHNKLFQGNRVVKVDCDSFNVFESPEVCPLVSLETTIKFSAIEEKKEKPKDPLSLKVEFKMKEASNVRILRFFPGITESYVHGILNGAEGVVLETFGAGNVPEVNWLRKLLMDANERNVLILNCTQVYRGTVVPIYAASEILSDAKVIPGYDITPVAAMTKMIWVLKSTSNNKERRKLMEHSVYGESSAPPMTLNLELNLTEE
ncbi:60 kDa lysophospholipase-like [Colossoma macropomum]|uniref:60 kDa lysophospholipase-like n=1 Tax=Colossoma macropomum TaxID=42526 RepID=UPI0018651E82|nr:60 kDa lysophospholipase-like [Colossoma macropomum]